MIYKPKFCCECSEKIERSDWRIWTNRRFCQLCETEFGGYDIAAKTLIILGLFFGLAGLAAVWRQPDKSLNIASKQFSANSSEKNVNNIRQADAGKLTIQSSEKAAPSKNIDGVQPIAGQKDVRPAPKTVSDTGVVQTQESVYFCGAQTKKGTACSRRVKGGGRCWQHLGQPAMFPQSKLLVSQ